MHWINRPLRRAKVDERLSWWSVGQTCYQVPLSTIDKLVAYRMYHVYRSYYISSQKVTWTRKEYFPPSDNRTNARHNFFY